MRKKPLQVFSWTALIVALLVLGYFIMLDFSMSSNGGVDYAYSEAITYPAHTPENDTAFGGVFMNNDVINDSLPHYSYQKKADSINAIIQQLDLQNKSIGSGGYNTVIGYYTIRKDGTRESQMHAINSALAKTLDSIHRTETDTVKRKALEQEIIVAAEAGDNIAYYLTLPGYSLDYYNQFFVANGRYYITTVDWEPVRKTGNRSGREGKYTRKQIPIRYAADSKLVMIPITKGQYRALMITFKVILVLMILIWVYALIGLPIQILTNISRGKAFTLKNISMLRFIAITVCCITVFSIAAPYLLRILFHNYIPEEFHRESFLNVLVNNFNWFLVSIAVFAVSVAFKKGYKLQQEQELTV